MSDCIKVAVRIRPLVKSETERGCVSCVETGRDEPQVIVQGERVFTFNYVFDQDATQQDVYEASVRRLVNELYKGYNVTVLAYGQTGSGKTHTMGTNHTDNALDNCGVIPRAVCDIFQHIHENTDWEYTINVSFLELYNEQLYDLLSQERQVVEIREDTKGICIPGLTEITVDTPEKTLKCLQTGSLGRVTGATAMNSQSSRSHAVFTITIHQQRAGEPHTATSAKFHLVDLAGSEKSKKTGAEGDRFKEGVNINYGLLSLGNVISALTEKQRPMYRNSKLTRLLQDSLGGNSITIMIACISPADYNLLETLNTLRYADRAGKIKNKPIVNQDPKSSEIAALKAKVAELQLQLAGQGGMPTEVVTVMDNGNQELVKELENKLRTLRQRYNESLFENTELRERMLMAETTRDKMRERVDEMEKEMQTKFLDFEALALPNDAKSCLDLLKKSFSEKLFNLVDEQKRGEEEQKRHETLSIPFDEPMDVEDETENLRQLDEHQEKHTEKQCELNKELREITKQLLLKEERCEQYAKTNVIASDTFKQSLVLKNQYEKQINELEKEKSDLMSSIKQLQAANKDADAKAKQSELVKKDSQIQILQKKLDEQAKIVKQKEAVDKKVEELTREIRNMKQLKVKLIKQMKAESEQWRLWRASRERETAQLRDQARKRTNEMARMQLMHDKQQNVSKRKLEQAVAANKRLKEALAKQKTVRAIRDMRGSKEQIKEFIAHEVEMLVSTVDAERSLQLLLEDRAALTEEIAALRRLTVDAAMTKRIDKMEREIELRNAQIADLQQKLVDSDQENKKSRWDVVASMSDAKIALTHAVRLAADIRRELLKKDSAQLENQQQSQTDVIELKEALQKAESNVHSLEGELRKIREEHQMELLNLEKNHQEALQALINSEKENVPLENELLKKEEEVTSLRGKLDTILAVTVTPQNKPRKRRSMHREFEDLNVSSDGSYINDDDEIADPNWRNTPLGKRLAALKNSRSSTNLLQIPVVRNRKRSLMNESLKCGCLSKCDSKRCICYRMNGSCGDHCSCNPMKCHFKLSSLTITNTDETAVSPNDTFTLPDSSLTKRRKV